MQEQNPATSSDDPAVRRLGELFASHPAWLAAAARLSAEASSNIYFAHRPGEGYRVVRRGKQVAMLPGPAPDPDFVFCFPPAAVDELAAVEGRVADFALGLFRLMADEDPRRQVGFRIHAPFRRLVSRGYLGLLLSGGLPVLAFGAARGVRTVAALRRLVESARSSQPAPWEHAAEAPRSAG